VAAANLVTRQWRQHEVAAFLPVSSAVATGTRLRAGTFEVIPNFVPDELVRHDPIPSSDGPIVFVGDLSWDKGAHVLLEAHRLLGGAPRLVLAGRTSPETSPESSAGVEFAGVLDPDEVQKLMTSASVVVVPSIVPDSCPTVVLEAMAAGRPVVATATGGIVDLVVDGHTGVLVPPGDAIALANALTSVLSDPARAARMGQAALEQVSRFTSSTVVTRIEAVYRRVAEERS
jgi:glycosyltransferase involved in cell wall biosynthesis